jgi:flagellar biogenesis protein FliO
MLYGHTMRPKNGLLDFAGASKLVLRWLSLPKRWAGKRSLQLLESVSLTAHASVALIRVERETLVLGVTPQNVTVLFRSATQDAPNEAGNPIP